jgi:hypothetical protein
MGGFSNLLEGIGRGRIDRIVMGKLGMDIDLLEGIQELVKREGVRTGVILSAIGALKKGNLSQSQNSASRSQGGKRSSSLPRIRTADGDRLPDRMDGNERGWRDRSPCPFLCFHSGGR